jgi:hypothetical protein
VLRDRRRVLIALAVLAVVGFVGGGIAAWLSRHDTICPDGRPPTSQQDFGLGQVVYKCRDGRLVTK